MGFTSFSYLSFLQLYFIFLIALEFSFLLVQNLSGSHPTHTTIWSRKARQREDGWQGDGESTKGDQHDDDVRTNIATEIVMVVQRNEQFNGKDVSHYIRDYKMVMLQYGISERLQVISFNRVATDEFKERIHGRQQQNSMWGSFEEALQEAYDYERSKGRVRCEFEQLVGI